MSKALNRSLSFVEDKWVLLKGKPPIKEGIYHIKYLTTNAERLAYWADFGFWGRGFYAVTELTKDNSSRRTFRVEPAMYPRPDFYQQFTGEHAIETETLNKTPMV